MLYRNLGRTGLKTSVIGIGGEWLNGKPQQVVDEVIHTAMEKGMNYIDIFMPQPEVRSAIGQALAGKRDKMIIQGHICTVVNNGQYERSRDLEKVKPAFEDLLERLQTDYIDVGMIHYVDSFEEYDIVFEGEIIEYVKDLKEKGVIKHIGLSSHNPLVALKAVETGLIDVLMFSINAAYDFEKAETDIYDLIEFKGLDTDNWAIDPARQALYGACERLGVGITVMKALGAGSLLKAESSPFKTAMTVTQCCHYCLTRPGVTSVLVGYVNKEEVLAAAAYTEADEAERDYSHIFSANEKVKISGRCMYCNHCLPCPAGIDIGLVTKFLHLAQEQENVPETVMAHYKALSKSAVDCTQCGLCETNCPFGVSIRENMKQASQVFSS